jgi:uncharacterized membrane protein YjfL (UPF0719 family)
MNPAQTASVPVWMPLAQAAFYSLIALVFMIFAKLVSNWITPYDDDDLIRNHRNSSVSIRTVGFFVAVVIGMAGALKRGVPELGRDALIFIVDGAVVLISLLIAEAVLSKIAFPKVSFSTQAKDNLLSGGILEASLFVATGLVLHGVFGSEGGTLLTGVAWVIGSQILLLLSIVIYKAVAPYKISDELEKGNTAAAIALAARILSMAIILRGVLDGESSGVVKTDVLFVAIYFAFGMILLSIINFLADLLFLPKYRINDAIVEQQNLAAALKIAGVQLAIAFIVASVL